MKSRPVCLMLKPADIQYDATTLTAYST